MLAVVLVIVAFGLGSIPFGLVVARLVRGIDPREGGSHNTGATNVSRLCGTQWGIVVLILDVFKGYLPAAAAPAILLGLGSGADAGAGAGAGAADWLSLSAIGLAAILGHIYSPLLHGKGGKAVATTIGVFLALAPLATLFALLCCAGAIALSGYVSMGSLTLALALPFFCLITGNLATLPLALVVMFLLFWRHRENILRLHKGEEMPWRKNKACVEGETEESED